MTASAQKAEVPKSVTTPDPVETRIGTLDFKDGMPSKATLAKVYDNQDFAHARFITGGRLRGGFPPC